MRVLAIDPGAERLGWAVIDRPESEESKDPIEVGCGIFGVKREVNEGKSEPYHGYRLRLIDFWVKEAPFLFSSFSPELVVSEIVPVVGSGSFVVATQSQLVSTAITTIQAMAREIGIPVKQIGASTVKKQIGGNGKATKVVVRNGVYKLIPNTLRFKKEWTKVFDMSDAFAVGLTELGYKVAKETN